MSQVGMLIGPVLTLGLAVLLAMGLALGSVWLALRVHAGARAGLALIAGAALLDGLMVTPRSVVLGIHVYPADPVFVLIAAVAAWRWIRQPGPPSGAGRALLGLALLSLGLFMLGLVRQGTAAGVEFRPIFQVCAAALYMATFRHDEAGTGRLVRVPMVLAAALVLLALLRWGDQLADFSGLAWGRLVGANPWRVLDADQALLLLLVWLWLFVEWSRDRVRGMGLLAMPALLAILVLLQHRTVWVCAVVAVLLLGAVDRGIRAATLQRGAPTLVAVLAGVALLAAWGGLDEPITALGGSVQEALAQRRSTFTWRLQSWSELVGSWRHGGPLVWLFGQPYGAGWHRYLLDLRASTDYSPHSFYVHTLLRGGLVGVALWLWVIGSTAGACVRRATAGVAGPHAPAPRERYLFGLAAVVVIGVYALTYNPDALAAALLGWVCSLCAEPQRAPGGVPLPRRTAWSAR